MNFKPTKDRPVGGFVIAKKRALHSKGIRFRFVAPQD